MLIENELNRLLTELNHAEAAKIQLNGFTVTVKVSNQCRGIFLSTPVYLGGNYIPKSVRGCLKRKAPFDPLEIETSLQVDEEAFQITLIHQGAVEPGNRKKFVDRLEDFAWLAERWRDYLDEHDKYDLVYIPVR